MNKIVVKLSILIMTVLVIFSVIIGSVFYVLFKEYSMDIHKEELLSYANGLINQECSNMSMHQSSYKNSSVRFLNDVSDISVWIIDTNYEVMKFGKKNQMGFSLHSKTLPSNANDIVESVFQGETLYSENFSETMDSPTLTLGVPILDVNGEVEGALLLHTPVESIQSAMSSGYKILLVSLVVALFLGLVISVFISYFFTKPLSKMKATAIDLSKGDYKSRTNIKQNDEIGDLSSTIDSLAVRLDEASKESEKLEKLRKEFMSNVSHELRTPITVMRGSLEVLNDGLIEDKEKVRDYHYQMLEEAKYLERLVDDLLELTKLENPDFKIDKRTVIMQDILNDVGRSAYFVARQKNIKLDIDLDATPLVIQGDYGRLRQMLWIVIDNSLKFSEKDHSIVLSIRGNEIIISDEGIGIEEDHLNHIFDRFYKVKNEQNKSGSGLGLSIAKGIAERHDIEMNIKNNEDRGISVVFKVNMP